MHLKLLRLLREVETLRDRERDLKRYETFCDIISYIEWKILWLHWSNSFSEKETVEEICEQLKKIGVDLDEICAADSRQEIHKNH